MIGDDDAEGLPPIRRPSVNACNRSASAEWIKVVDTSNATDSLQNPRTQREKCLRFGLQLGNVADQWPSGIAQLSADAKAGGNDPELPVLTS
jgi:hypothetical protein